MFPQVSLAVNCCPSVKSLPVAPRVVILFSGKALTLVDELLLSLSLSHEAISSIADRQRTAADKWRYRVVFIGMRDYLTVNLVMAPETVVTDGKGE